MSKFNELNEEQHMNVELNEPNENTQDEKKPNQAWELIKSIISVVVLALIIRTFIFNATLVDGNSMNPSLHHHDRLISFKVPLYFSEPKRGDIIVLEAPNGSGDDYIKRVIGVPGDEIVIAEGQVYVNGEIKEEHYIHDDVDTLTSGENYWILEENEFFVMGDNRLPGESLDSRVFGPIEFDSIHGIARLRYWPLQDFGIMSRE